MFPPPPPRRARFSPLRLIVALPTIAAGLLGGLSLAISQEIPATELILDRDAHSRVIEVTSMESDRYGSGPRVWQYTEVQNGMHYWEDGEWLETLELIEPFPDGAVARFGPHKLILSPNLNVEGAIDLAMPDGTRMQVQPIGLAWFDAATGQSAWIGLVQDCQGEVVGGNQVIWPRAFSGIDADIRLTYTKAGVETDVILREHPRLPAGLDPRSARIQMITEFVYESEPEVRQVVVREERDPVLRADWVEPDLVDSFIDFGPMQIVAGVAFALPAVERPTLTAGVAAPVAKRWQPSDLPGRYLLFETVEYQSVLADLERLPLQDATARAALQPALDYRIARSPRALEKPMQLAQHQDNRAGFVIDWTLVQSISSYTFVSGKTYKIASYVTIAHATFQSGAFVKFTTPAFGDGNGKLTVSSSISTPGLLQPRAVLTHINDNSVGEHLGNGVPNDKYDTALALYPFTGSGSPTVKRLDIRHATTGMHAYIPPYSLTVQNCIVRKCTTGIGAYYTTVHVQQVFMCDVYNPLRNDGGSSFPIPDWTAVCDTSKRPEITVQPGNLTRTVGQSATFNVTATGYGLTYQWYFNGASIPGATSTSNTISSVQHTHAGQYRVVVANDFGSVRSVLATLTVNGAPLIITQPASQVAYLGGSVTFSVAALGNTPFTYQWRKNGTNISGATGHEYTINNIQSGDFANYSVTVYNTYGSASSANAALTQKTVGSHWVYTSNTDFQKGYLINLNQNVSGELRLNADPTPLPYLNVACSARGTLVRLDVNSGASVGEYRTAPGQAWYSGDPSRVAVDRHGNTWVGNRGDGPPSGGTTVTCIGVAIGGVRGNRNGSPPNHSFQPHPQGEYLKPPFIYNTCVDRDGDGLIRTSRGMGNVLAWTSGGVSSAEDEAILYHTLTECQDVRMVAVDAANDVWVGGNCNKVHQKISGVTGGIVAGSRLPTSGEGQGGGYIGLVDGYGVMWSGGRTAGGCNPNLGLIRYDPAFSNLTVLGNSYGDYGLAVDPQTHQIWYGAWDRSHVAKYDRWGNVLATHYHGNVYAHGMVVDNRNRVWVSHNKTPNYPDHTGITVGQLRTDGTFIGNVALGQDQQFFHVGPTGLSVDRNQKVWVANTTSNSVIRINPDAGPYSGLSDQYRIGEVDLVVDLRNGSEHPSGLAATPYTMGDMTGFIALGATRRSGSWVLVQDGSGPNKAWHKVSWNPTSQLSGTGLSVEVRAANTITGLPSNPFVTVGNNVTFSNVTGRYLEVRVTLWRNPSVANNPRLADLTVHWPQ